MSRAALGPGGELDGLVAGGEVNVKVGEEGVDVVVALNLKLKRNLKIQICLGNSLDVDVFEDDTIGIDRLARDNVN
jgi:predicted methyltransferase